MNTLRNGKSEAVPSSDFASGPTERETADLATETRNSETTLSDRLYDLLDRAKDYWAVPAWVREPPATLIELTDYARSGAWTKRLSGPVRKLGIFWLYAVAIPQTAKAYLKAHLMQRPGRIAAVLVIWFSYIYSPPGVWTADHLIRPYFQALAWIFLP